MNRDPHHISAAESFERVGDDYEQTRPEYPKAALAKMIQELNLDSNSKIIEVGAGTGKFTRLLETIGGDLIAVEPAADMRRIISETLPEIKIINAGAESIPLPDASCDAVVVAQAFHWFDCKGAANEFHRLLKPGGSLALVWNTMDGRADWMKEIYDILEPHASGAPRYEGGKWKEAFTDNPQFTPFCKWECDNHHELTHDRMIRRIGSISFMAALDEPDRAETLGRIGKLLSTHPALKLGDLVKVPYRCELFWCQRL